MDKNEATSHDDDGWKNHDGKSFPPDNYDATHVKMRNGEAIPRALSSSLGACWIWRGEPTDIVAYRPCRVHVSQEQLGRAVDDLAIALGMWIGTAYCAGTEVTEVQRTCYIEALVMLVGYRDTVASDKRSKSYTKETPSH